MAITAGVIGVGSAIDQKKAAERAEKRRVRANQIEKARAEIERGLERKRAAARLRQAQAFNIAGAEVAGITQGSSAVQGAQGALGSTFATSVASANRSFVSGQSAFDLRQRAAFTEQNAAANAAIAAASGQLIKSVGDTFKVGLTSVAGPAG